MVIIHVWKRWRVCSWRCLIWDIISITLLLLEPHPFWLYQHNVSYRREVYPAFDAELAKYHLTEMANSSSRRCLGTSGWLITTYLFLWGFYFNQFWLTVWKNTQIINKQMSKKSTGTEGTLLFLLHSLSNTQNILKNDSGFWFHCNFEILRKTFHNWWAVSFFVCLHYVMKNYYFAFLVLFKISQWI